MVVHHHVLISTFIALLLSTACSEDHLYSRDGTLLARVLNPHQLEVSVEVTMTSTQDPQHARAEVELPETSLSLQAVPTGLWQVTVNTLGSFGEPLRSVVIDDIYIQPDRETEVVIDLSELGTPPTEAPEEEPEPQTQEQPCSEDDDYPICQACIDGVVVDLIDDPACGIISCEAYDDWTLTGDNSAQGSSSCIFEHAPDITENRCIAPGVCVEANEETCPAATSTLAQAGLCEFILECEAGYPTINIYPDGTPCLSNHFCQNGACIPIEPEAGCSDGTRDGFLSVSTYPLIAACSGGWSIGGVTRDDLVPTCNHQSGNNSNNPDGSGCSAVDLCSPGWHVCQGHQEVSEKSPSGCADAVPPGTPNKGLFFAIYQNSTNSSTCDNTDEANDVFGCGNLGNELSGSQNCGPLTRVLASTQPNSCGYNEAEPGHGPWQCLGDNNSHFSEGALVTKDGCPGNSCSYDGYSVGNQDRGGVLCCRN